MTEQTRLYGVSSGNGNDGVSHMFADYYVKTDKPWLLAQAAILSEFKPGKGQAWALDNAEIDGEAEYTISAMILDPPNDESEDGEYATVYVCSECDAEGDDSQPCESCGENHWQEKEYSDYEDGRNWSESNGAWLIVEVFPMDGPNHDAPTYESLADCFSAEVLALCDKD